MTLREMKDEIELFWGAQGAPVNKTNVRKEKIAKLVERGMKFGTQQNTKYSLLFPIGKAAAPPVGKVGKATVGTNDHHRLLICEQAMLTAISHQETHSYSTIRRTVLEGKVAGVSQDELMKMIKQTKHATEIHARPQQEHARTFLEMLASPLMSDAVPDADGCEDNVAVLPFEKLSQIYTQYVADTPSHVKPASMTTFADEWKKLKAQGKVKFSRSKGTLSTCDVCTNCNDYLAACARNGFTRGQHDIFYQYKVLHLKQQSEARLALQNKKNEAILARDKTTHAPTHAVLFGDGMTKYAGRTPRYSRNYSKKDTHFFENRVFGVEFYCGPVQGDIRMSLYAVVLTSQSKLCVEALSSSDAYLRITASLFRPICMFNGTIAGKTRTGGCLCSTPCWSS